MIEVRAFCPGDLLAMDVQPAQQKYDAASSFLDQGALYEANGPAITILRVGENGEKEILCAVGLLVYQAHHATAWAFLADNKRSDFVVITRIIKRMLDRHDFSRIDAYAHAKFDAAGKWLRMMGFDFEARLCRHAPDGGDHHVYVRLKDC